MKIIKKISISLIAVGLIFVSISQAFAETIYEYYGLSYMIISNTELSVVGWDNRSEELRIPAQINGRGIASIGNGAFEGNTFITSLNLAVARNLNRIGAYSFQDCTGLNTELVLPKSITAIENRAFQGCSAIPSVIVNSLITVIPNQCFMDCSSLKTVELSEGIEQINAWAFANCSSMEYINIPKTVTFISDYAFSNAPNLTLGVWYGTTGYDYAKAQNIPYVLLDGVKLGDVNGDGIVNINDVTAIQQHLAEYVFLEGISLHAADVDQNGEVKIDDATLLQEFLAEYTVGHPVGEVMTQ